jgi:RNA polymerase sigma-70 factor (ECF subfamily)
MRAGAQLLQESSQAMASSGQYAPQSTQGFGQLRQIGAQLVSTSDQYLGHDVRGAVIRRAQRIPGCTPRPKEIQLGRPRMVSEPPPTERPTLEALYRDHFDFVFRVARHLGGRVLDPEDVAQEVFVVVSRRLDSFEYAAPQATTLLYGITLNVVRTMRRRHRLEALFRADEAEGANVAAVSVERSDVVDAWRGAQDILATMSEKKREVFVLAEVEGQSCAEIAKLVSAKEETVWSRLHYARAEFIARLAELRRTWQPMP